MKFYILNNIKHYLYRRSPHGERGLKFSMLCVQRLPKCRSPHGERGLKSEQARALFTSWCRRSPHGERGLKFATLITKKGGKQSLSSRRAWIEIISIIEQDK